MTRKSIHALNKKWLKIVLCLFPEQLFVVLATVWMVESVNLLMASRLASANKVTVERAAKRSWVNNILNSL